MLDPPLQLSCVRIASRVARPVIRRSMEKDTKVEIVERGRLVIPHMCDMCDFDVALGTLPLYRYGDEV